MPVFSYVREKGNWKAGAKMAGKRMLTPITIFLNGSLVCFSLAKTRREDVDLL